jgi:hypothetical protein
MIRNRTRTATLAMLVLAPSSALAQAGGECRFEASRDATLAATASETLQLIARSGSLRVEGRPGATEVRVRGRACASSEDLLEQLRLHTDRGGSAVRVEVAEIDSDWNWRDGRNQYARMDLVIEVPAGMAADIEDGSGSMVLRGLGNLRVEDGSGDIEIEDIDGDIRVDDGSGDVRLTRIRGDVEVDDGSGSVDIRDVTGSVLLDDGSGSVTIAGVGGSVRIPDDGTGDLDVRDVRGDLIVGDKGNGNVRHANIDGRVDVPVRERRRRRG